MGCGYINVRETMSAYQTTVTTTSGSETVGYVIFANESYEASKEARKNANGVIGAETVAL